MLECLILGDSLAVGVGLAKPACEVHAQVGINSHDWNQKFSGIDLAAGAVLISLGSNDHAGVRTEAELRRLRQRTRGQRVFWVMPNIKPEVQRLVVRIAKENGDQVIQTRSLSADKVHPTPVGYRELAQKFQR